MDIKEILKECKEAAPEVPRSDLQGITMCKAIQLNKNKIMEIDNIFLLYCDGEIDINTAKRYIQDLLPIAAGE